MLHTTSIKRWSLLLMPLLLTGCGLTQKISDSTLSAVKSVFYKQVNVLHLDVTARAELNTDERENTSLSQPVMVWVYQLSDRKTFDKRVYQQLVTESEEAAGDERLASRSLVVKPGADVSLDIPMDEKAQFIAVVGLFRAPDMVKNDWKLVLRRDDLDPDKPRIIEASHNRLTLKPLKDD
ncbi:type VI secretion system lipoprotein TssJ [Klebsiella michiganensis]|nr:type VI secretion system lipoprotein TssJ [Klebsiella michiganensis]TWW06138.1 type VI secretion system lipoprotein TssJ [Klebsiella sp. ME-303]MBZ7189649.1 type VI secretion system lipoprotein TssJ [Klebsiella michiganensis]MBZ7232831.1 type VI secretion system lipoprotein TssJ [Klebsiella michiganensis]HBM2971275.1 type VI secretion system lipoprotein TssJ [Klebsiella michiganensis]